MNDLALNLVERVLPEVPIRQWVCSLPWQLRYLLGYDRVLCAAVLQAFVLELMSSYKRRAKRMLGLRSLAQAHTGAVTFVQRFDSALRLNVHAHTLALDGVYVREQDSSALRFHALAEPSAEGHTFAVDVLSCPSCQGRMRLIEVATIATAVARVLARAGMRPQPPPRPRPVHQAQLALGL